MKHLRNALAALLALPLAGCIAMIDRDGGKGLEKRIGKLEKRIERLESSPQVGQAIEFLGDVGEWVEEKGRNVEWKLK